MIHDAKKKMDTRKGVRPGQSWSGLVRSNDNNNPQRVGPSNVREVMVMVPTLKL